MTDAAYLYWADGQAIRRMPICGGPPVALANGAGLGHVALDAGYVYYTSGTTVRRVPKGTAGALREAGDRELVGVRIRLRAHFRTCP